MRLKSVCMACQAETNSLNKSMFLSIEYRNSTLQATCEKGHTTRTIVQATDFEILFEFGGMALLDGYTREAISCFAAALERGYMCYVHCALLQGKVPSEVVKEANKELRRSERQLGAFVSLYSLLEHSSPPILPNKLVELRNKCIHEGEIPSRSDVEEYGQQTLERLEKILGILRSKYNAEFMDVTHARSWKEAVAAGFNPSSAAIPTMLTHTHEALAQGSLKERLERLKQYRRGMWSE